MTDKVAKNRNEYVDVLRGIAMLLVVFGHTMTGCTSGAYDSFLYNVIWSIQMPLFILLSGFVTKYSRGVGNRYQLLKYIIRRTVSYLLPWVVWSILIRGIVFSEKEFLDLKWLLWHMDSGYWFLVTIWTISMIFGLSAFLAHKISREKTKETIFLFLFYIIGMGCLGGIGYYIGFAFFAIKLTLYYMPFFFLGFLYGRYSNKVLETKRNFIIVEFLVAVSALSWIAILSMYNLYSLADSGKTAILRGFSSLTGCVAVCGLVYGVLHASSKNRIGSKILCWCGSHSLEIYVTHYIFLNVFEMKQMPSVESIEGAALTMTNFAITLLVVIAIIQLFDHNRVLRFVLYGKMRDNQTESSIQMMK